MGQQAKQVMQLKHKKKSSFFKGDFLGGGDKSRCSGVTWRHWCDSHGKCFLSLTVCFPFDAKWGFRSHWTSDTRMYISQDFSDPVFMFAKPKLQDRKKGLCLHWIPWPACWWELAHTSRWSLWVLSNSRYCTIPWFHSLPSLQIDAIMWIQPRFKGLSKIPTSFSGLQTQGCKCTSTLLFFFLTRSLDFVVHQHWRQEADCWGWLQHWCCWLQGLNCDDEKKTKKSPSLKTWVGITFVLGPAPLPPPWMLHKMCSGEG